jgi:hypothetical protein
MDGRIVGRHSEAQLLQAHQHQTDEYQYGSKSANQPKGLSISDNPYKHRD